MRDYSLAVRCNAGLPCGLFLNDRQVLVRIVEARSARARSVLSACPVLRAGTWRRYSEQTPFSTVGRSNGGKSPGTQVQHTLSIGTKGTEFRRFLASKCGTVRAITKSARGFAPIARRRINELIVTGIIASLRSAA